MGNLAIMRPYPNVAIVSAVGAGGTNLLTRDPKEAWIPQQSGAYTGAIIDLGSRKLMDSCFIMGLFPVGCTWSLAVADDAALSVNRTDPVFLKLIPMSQATGTMAKDLVTFPPVVGRYFAATVTWSYGTISAPAPSVGIMQVGRSFVPQYGREYGSGRPIFDTGSAERLKSGGFGINEGVRKSGYNWTMGDLSLAEKDFLFNQLIGVGQSGPIIMAEDITPPDMPTLISNLNMTIAGRVATKAAGGTAWNASAISPTSYTGKGIVVAKASQTNAGIVVGLNSDPLTDNDPASIDFAVGFINNGTAQMQESGGAVVAPAAYTATDVFAVAYDDGVVRYAKNDVLLRTVADAGANRSFSIDSSFNAQGSSATLQFYGPDGFSEGIHYGILQNIEPYERASFAATRWNFKIEEWV